MNSTGFFIYVVVLAICLVAVRRYGVTLWSAGGMLLIAAMAMLVAGINALQARGTLWIGVTLLVAGALMAHTLWRRRPRTS